MALTKRLVKGSAITAAEHDANLDHVQDRANHTGTQAIATISGLGSGDNLLMTAAERTKLTGVEANATADQTGAEIVASLDTQLGSSDWQSGGGSGPTFGGSSVTDVAAGTNITFADDGDGTITLNVSSGTATLGDGDYGDITVSGGGTVMTVDAGAVALADLADWPADVTATEVGYLDGVTSAIQTQIDARSQIHAEAIGDGSATSIAVTHNLGTRDVVVQLYDASTFAEVIPDVTRTDANTVTLAFGSAPTAGQYRVVVQG